MIFQSTLPARGATRLRRDRQRHRPISIHAPREGSDAELHAVDAAFQLFQSTLPARGATPDFFVVRLAHDISIHAPREGSDADGDDCRLLILRISIHAPREGSDAREVEIVRAGFLFQSTLPARGATDRPDSGTARSRISIHAPREGSDGDPPLVQKARSHFNPRSPRGERPARLWRSPRIFSYFNPRSPRGERLRRCSARTEGYAISIHAPREGSDRSGDQSGVARFYFNPRSPRGERRQDARASCCAV